MLDDSTASPFETQPDRFDPPRTPKTSVIGWTSLILMLSGMLVGGVPFAALVVMGVVSEINGTSLDDDDPILMVGGCGVILGLAALFPAMVTGVIGCVLPGRKVVPLLALCFSAPVFMVILAILAIGLAMP
ncbi:MAG: hypothetical protein AAFY08_01225 [Planctomycetota bacterium]